MYFDTIVNGSMQPVFNGTPDEILEFLQEHAEVIKTSDRVVMGRSLALVTPSQYVNLHNKEGKNT